MLVRYEMRPESVEAMREGTKLGMRRPALYGDDGPGRCAECKKGPVGPCTMLSDWTGYLPPNTFPKGPLRLWFSLAFLSCSAASSPSSLVWAFLVETNFSVALRQS